MKITEPGLYTEITAEQYHSDPAPSPSLSNSVAKILLSQSPRHAWHAHARLNPNYDGEAGSTRRLDLGSVAHALLLGKGRVIEVIDADDYKGKAAKAQRDEARMLGKLPVLAPDYDRASTMEKIARDEINACRDVGPMFNSSVARSEAVVLWREDDCWARCMIDRTDGITVLDYKTCPNAAPDYVARHLYSNDYHIQRAFYLRGLDAVDASGAGRRRFVFLFQEIDQPHACTFMEVDGTGATLGDRQVGQAFAAWKDCTSNDRWPSYPRGIHRAEMPGWMETTILAKEIAEDERRKAGRQEPMLESLMGG